MTPQQQRILNLINGDYGSAKLYNKATGKGEAPARVKTHLGVPGVVIFADSNRATILLENGHKLEAGWPKVELLAA